MNLLIFKDILLPLGHKYSMLRQTRQKRLNPSKYIWCMCEPSMSSQAVRKHQGTESGRTKLFSIVNLKKKMELHKE